MQTPIYRTVLPTRTAPQLYLAEERSVARKVLVYRERIPIKLPRCVKIVTQGNLSAADDRREAGYGKLRAMVIWLASYPRSGNTLFRILLHSVFGFQTYSVYPGPNTGALTPEQIRKSVELLGKPNLECDLNLLQADSGKHFVKTHDLPRDDTFPAIVVVRDGRDAVVSYAHFVLKTEHGVEMPARGPLFEKTLEELIVGEQFGGWSRNVSAWIERAGWASVVRYEDLIEDPVNVVGGTLARLGLGGESNGATPPSFEELHAFSPWFFRRGKPGCWREEMPKHLEELFLEKHGDTLVQIPGSDEPRDSAGQFGKVRAERSGGNISQ